MARATFVKKARKDNPVVKKGESYYWWAFMQGGRGGPKRYSKTQPTRSQLTQSEFYRAVYQLEDSFDWGDDLSELPSLMEQFVSEIQEIHDECEGKFDSLPESLQGSATGELLEERRCAMETWISEVESVDLDVEIEEDETDAEIFERILNEITEICCEV